MRLEAPSLRVRGPLRQALLRRGPRTMVPAPDAPFATAVEDDHHSVLLEGGKVVARLFDPPPVRGADFRPMVNELSHHAYVPMPWLLDQMSRGGGREGAVFHSQRDGSVRVRRWWMSEEAGAARVLAAQRSEAERLRPAIRAATGV